MLKRIITTSVVAMLMFSGCGDEAGEDFLSAQHSVDIGDYNGALALLEATPLSQRTEAQNVQIGSAYMAKAGFSVLDIVGTMANGVDANGTDALDSFKNIILYPGIDKNATLANIDAAIASYKLVTLDSNATSLNDLGDNELSLGLAYMVKASILLDNNDSSQNAELAATMTDAFYFISNVGSTEMASDIDTMQQEAFGSSDGNITAADIQAYLGN